MDHNLPSLCCPSRGNSSGARRPFSPQIATTRVGHRRPSNRKEGSGGASPILFRLELALAATRTMAAATVFSFIPTAPSVISDFGALAIDGYCLILATHAWAAATEGAMARHINGCMDGGVEAMGQ